MKDQVKDMFAQITMPERTEEAILKAMEHRQKPAKEMPKAMGRTVAVVAAMLALVVTISPTARAAANNVVRYVFGDYSAIVMDTETGEIQSAVSYPAYVEDEENSGVLNCFVEATDGKMYFCAGEEYIDITDKTSMDTPYIYTYIDNENIEHLLIIGGVPDNFGVSEFYREAVEGQKSWQGWIGGYSENYIDNKTGKAYPWVAAAWEELNLPWPVPGE